MPRKKRFLLTCPKRSKKKKTETEDANVGDDVEEHQEESEENSNEEDVQKHLCVDMTTDNIFRDHDDNKEKAIPVQMEDRMFKSDNFSKEKIDFLMKDDDKPFKGISNQVDLETGEILQQKGENSHANLAQRTYALETHNRILKNKLDTIERESAAEIARLNAEIERLKKPVLIDLTEDSD